VTDPQLGLANTYCEGSVLGVPGEGMLYFGQPSAGGRRANYVVTSSNDSGLAWSAVGPPVWGGGAAYSDLAMTHHGDVAFVFERGPSDRYPYAWLTFGKVAAVGGAHTHRK
jgi:hypothetical protein